MKKALVALAIAAFASTATAAIANSAHDLSTRANANLSSCQYCHAPHFANITVTGAPLWNRNMGTTTALTPYSSTTLNDTTVAVGPNSLTCLTCHDGTQDLGSTYRGTDDTLGNVLTWSNVGSNLTDDHPVGVNYPNLTTATDFVAYATVNAAGGVELYAGQVECASCHDPHGNSLDGGGSDNVSGGQSFLRVAATGMCSACHIK